MQRDLVQSSILQPLHCSTSRVTAVDAELSNLSDVCHPVLMDAGVAAVLGAVVGVAGTIGAAALGWLSARSQLQAQRLIDYDERRRQARRDAYAAFLAHLSKVRVPLMESLEALEQPAPDLDAILQRLEAAQHEAIQNNSISYAVMLEGPAKVAEIASGTMEAITAMNGLMREHCKRLLEGDDTEDTRSLIEELGIGIGTYGAAFLACAREALELEDKDSIAAEPAIRLRIRGLRRTPTAGELADRGAAK
jgi:hypothetical protein